MSDSSGRRDPDGRVEPALWRGQVRSRPRGLADLRLDDLFGAGTAPKDDPFGVGAASEDDPFVPSKRRSDRSVADPSVTRSSPKGSLLARGARAARWRIDPERRGAVAVMGAVLVAVVAVGWQALAGRPHAEAVTNATTSSAAWSTESAATGSSGVVRLSSSAVVPSAAAKVVVDVVGRVHHPGLVRLPPGARVADAVRAAGGALPQTNLSSINLARVCVDGEQIAVGVAGALAPTGSVATAGSTAPAALVNLNTATADQLDALPGVGPVMAQRIIAYRTDHGPFTSVDQLRQVSGIGDAKFADLSPLVTVG